MRALAGWPRTKREFRSTLDIAMGVLPPPLYQRQRRTYLLALRAGYKAGYTRVQMTYAREFLASVRRMRLPHQH
jgi:hypothetical protein